MTRVFYDGDCGLCQRSVRFLAKRDRAAGLRFAPQGGATFQAVLSPAVRAGLPDTLVVVTPGGDVLLRAAALRHLLARLGLGWRLLGRVLGWLPRGLADGGYDWVARHRRRMPSCALQKTGEDRFEP